MQIFNNKKVLISPIYCGLGHTTRCIAIVRLLLDNHCSVFVACNNKQKFLLQQEFNNLQFIHLEGYDITYTKYPFLFPFKLISQLLKISKSIKREYLWLQKKIEELNIDLVISDNRYGFHSPKVP